MIRPATHNIVRKVRELLGIRYHVFQFPRILKYKILSDRNVLRGVPRIIQPVLFVGKGYVHIGKNVTLGVWSSPFLYRGDLYIEDREPHSRILIGNHVWMNNNCVLVSEGEGIEIGNHTLFGSCVEVHDSDFHDLHPERRMKGVAKTAPVVIGNNVFVGSNARILKGVTIGDNAVIANSAVVVHSIPPGVIAGGNPDRILKSL